MGLPFSKIIQNGQEYDVKVSEEPAYSASLTNPLRVDILHAIESNIDFAKLTCKSLIKINDDVYNIHAFDSTYAGFTQVVSTSTRSTITNLTLYKSQTNSKWLQDIFNMPTTDGNITGYINDRTNNSYGSSYPVNIEVYY